VLFNPEHRYVKCPDVRRTFAWRALGVSLLVRPARAPRTSSGALAMAILAFVVPARNQESFVPGYAQESSEMSCSTSCVDRDVGSR